MNIFKCYFFILIELDNFSSVMMCSDIKSYYRLTEIRRGVVLTIIIRHLTNVQINSELDLVLIRQRTEVKNGIQIDGQYVY